MWRFVRVRRRLWWWTTYSTTHPRLGTGRGHLQDISKQTGKKLWLGEWERSNMERAAEGKACTNIAGALWIFWRVRPVSVREVWLTVGITHDGAEEMDHGVLSSSFTRRGHGCFLRGWRKSTSERALGKEGKERQTLFTVALKRWRMSWRMLGRRSGSCSYVDESTLCFRTPRRLLHTWRHLMSELLRCCATAPDLNVISRLADWYCCLSRRFVWKFLVCYQLSGR